MKPTRFMIRSLRSTNNKAIPGTWNTLIRHGSPSSSASQHHHEPALHTHQTEQIAESHKSKKEPSYVGLFQQQLAYLRTTNNLDGTISLFSEMKQTGLPLPSVLFQEVLIALNTSNRFTQVESMYLDMRRDGVVPCTDCLHIRLQGLINCMDKAKDKGEPIFWLDKKLKDIQEEIAELQITTDARIYASLLLLSSKGNVVEQLESLWLDYCRRFPKQEDAPPVQIITTIIRAAAERFEHSRLAQKINDDAMLLYNFIPTPQVTESVCLSALLTGDADTALYAIKTVSPVSIMFLQKCLSCAAQTGSVDLYDFAYSRLQARLPTTDLDLFYNWRLITLARAGKPSAILDLLCAPDQPAALLTHSQLLHLALAMFSSVSEVDAAYFYLERMAQQGKTVPLVALDLIICGCGLLKDFERAQETFQSLSAFQLEPAVSTFNSVLLACLCTQNFDVVPNIIEVLQQQDNNSEQTGSMMMTSDTYEYLCKIFLAQGNLQLLLKVIIEASSKQIELAYPVYEAAVKALISSGHSDGAHLVVSQMKKLNIDSAHIQQYVSNFAMTKLSTEKF